MSLFYNRDRNISGANVLTGLVFNPVYGSTASFSTKTNFVNYNDKVPNISPLGINNIVGEFSLNFPLRKNDTQDLLNFYESQSGTGFVEFNDGSNIYQKLSGVFNSLDSLESQNNDKFNVALKFSVERNASILKWSGQSFVNHDFKRWESGASYTAYETVYFENDLEEPANNFFYCLTGHDSSVANHPLSSGQKWSKDLFLAPNDQFSIQQVPSVAQNDFNASFLQRVNVQKNIHSFDKMEVSYKNISDQKTKALLHFLESRMGTKKFKYSIPQIYDKPKIFYAPAWEHQWVSKDSNNLKISLSEDPLGLLYSGKPSLTLSQESGYSSLNFSITGDDRLFLDTGNGKELATNANINLTWPSTGTRHQAKIWGRLAGFTGTGQGLVKAQFSAKNLTHLNLSGNNISVLNLYDEVKLKRLVCPNNTIGGLDVANKTLLSYVDYSNNLGNYFNLGGSVNLTGIKADGNRIPSLYLDSSLGNLVSGGMYSGYVNFSGSSGVSAIGNSYASQLTGRGWTVNYEYYPMIEAATTPPPNPTLAPVTGYPISLNFAFSADSACYGGTAVSILMDSPFFASATAINFAGQTSLETGSSPFYISDGVNYKIATKICCDIATLEVGASCIVPTTFPPPTTTTTTTIPPTTTTTTVPPTTTTTFAPTTTTAPP